MSWASLAPFRSLNAPTKLLGARSSVLPRFQRRQGGRVRCCPAQEGAVSGDRPPCRALSARRSGRQRERRAGCEDRPRVYLAREAIDIDASASRKSCRIQAAGRLRALGACAGASALHWGADETIGRTYEAVRRWIRENG